jgi:hypothetical protein
MMEKSVSGSVPLTNGSGIKNLQIRNTVKKEDAEVLCYVFSLFGRKYMYHYQN